MTYKVNTKLEFDEQGNIKLTMYQLSLIGAGIFVLSTVLYLLAQLIG